MSRAGFFPRPLRFHVIVVSVAEIEVQTLKLIERRLETLQSAGVAIADQDDHDRLATVLRASDFAYDLLNRRPSLWPPEPLGPEVLSKAPAAQLAALREAVSLHFLAADLAGSPVEHALAGMSGLADAVIRRALQLASERVIRDTASTSQGFVVMALGKLGGRELNFSSDVDLVFAFDGQPADRQPADDRLMLRLGRELIRILEGDGGARRSFRVDMRLRPFGGAGPIAMSLDALERYFQREGRDWERYAWIKARPVAGDLSTGERLVARLEPFVFRRYLDFDAIDGLRAMKVKMDAEVRRQGREADLKRGPGGIREIEFIVQLEQLIRGGRAPQLRSPGLLETIDALTTLQLLEPAVALELADDYRLLRLVENRVQMFGDAQTHALPAAPLDRHRIATALGAADAAALDAVLRTVRARVGARFADVFSETPARSITPHRDADAGSAAEPSGASNAVAEPVDIGSLDELMRAALDSPAARRLGQRSQARLAEALGQTRALLAPRPDGLEIWPRLQKVLMALAGRSSYLALLTERPQALRRLVDQLSRSDWLASRVAAQPILLDELLDHRDRAGLGVDEAFAAIETSADDERFLIGLNEAKASATFRAAIDFLAGRAAADATTARLARIADAVLAAVLARSLARVVDSHGAPPPGSAFAIAGYGSLGAAELGLDSDLDVVFIYDGDEGGRSAGAERPLETGRFYGRVAQRMLSMLATVTPAGRLHEIDLRLRPDGARAVLVTSIDAMSRYQEERAWLWERQALIRSRAVAGDEGLAARFEALRRAVLGKARDVSEVESGVWAMRERLRAELDRSDDRAFDLKQGLGGLVDLQFWLQCLVLCHAHEHPALLMSPRSDALLGEIAALGLASPEAAATLALAHQDLQAAALAATLDSRPRLALRSDSGIVAATARIREICLPSAPIEPP